MADVRRQRIERFADQAIEIEVVSAMKVHDLKYVWIPSLGKEYLMLSGKLLRLRPVQESDLDLLYSRMNTLEHRGAFFPINLYSEPKFRRDFEETGFWSRDEGMVLMVNADDEIVDEGRILARRRDARLLVPSRQLPGP